MHPGVNFINMFMRNFFVRKTKKLLVFENELHHAFLYENCVGFAICKSHLVVLVATRKSQLALHKKSFQKAMNKNEIKPLRGLHKILMIVFWLWRLGR